MASIIKRKKAYSVVYSYTDENGEIKQKWETWHTHKEALKRKAETTIDIAALIEQLQANPELEAALAGLIGTAKK